MLKLTGTPRVAVALLVSMGTTAVVGNVISATTPVDLSKIQKIQVKVGGFAVGVTAGAIAAKYTLEYVDETLDAINTIVAIAKAKTH